MIHVTHMYIISFIYSVSTKFHLELIEPSAGEVFVFGLNLSADGSISSRQKLVHSLYVQREELFSY